MRIFKNIFQGKQLYKYSVLYYSIYAYRLVFSATQMIVRTLQAKGSRQTMSREEQSEVADDADVAEDACEAMPR